MKIRVPISPPVYILRNIAHKVWAIAPGMFLKFQAESGAPTDFEILPISKRVEFKNVAETPSST